MDLKVAPDIDQYGNVKLDLNAEFSNPDWVSAVGGVPAVMRREAKTKLLLRPGETVIIAGLLQRNVSRAVKRVPVLGYIPVLNWFFSASQTQVKETELLIFVTPIIPGEITVKDFKKSVRMKTALIQGA